MLALRAAWAAYVDGWARVLKAPWLLAGLAAALITAVLMQDPVRWEAGPANGLHVLWMVGAGAIAGVLTMAGFTTIDTHAGWGVGLIVFVVGTALTGGVIDRYARQRPLDARAFWGVSGELAFRLLRLNLLTAGALAVWNRLLFVPVVLLVPGEDASLAVYQALLVILAALQFVVGECARVRIVVERRRSVLFAIVAGTRFLTRHLGQVAFLAAVLALTFVPAVLIEARWPVDPRAACAAASGVLVAALVSCASLTSLFQASLAHARYVAPPRLVWPDSPAIETLGERRDFPPAV